MDRLSICAKLVEAERKQRHVLKNRVLEIKDKDDITFRYINTKQNPADFFDKGNANR